MNGVILLVIAAMFIPPIVGAQTFTGCLKGGRITEIQEDDNPINPCTPNETQVSWSQQGPQGDQGDRGPKGKPR